MLSDQFYDYNSELIFVKTLLVFVRTGPCLCSKYLINFIFRNNILTIKIINQPHKMKTKVEFRINFPSPNSKKSIHIIHKRVFFQEFPCVTFMINYVK